jgi:hypothetical protein
MTRVDADTAQVTTVQNVTLQQLQARLALLQAEKDKWDAQYQPMIDDVQAQIDAMATAGVDNALPMASQSVQDNLMKSIKAQPLQVKGTLSEPGTGTGTGE